MLKTRRLFLNRHLKFQFILLILYFSLNQRTQIIITTTTATTTTSAALLDEIFSKGTHDFVLPAEALKGAWFSDVLTAQSLKIGPFKVLKMEQPSPKEEPHIIWSLLKLEVRCFI